jgi:uncharacterized membrane protein YtjA (UPF0391 family)
MDRKEGHSIVLRWSIILFILSLVEGAFGHPLTGSRAIAKVSFALAAGLFVMFQFSRRRKIETDMHAGVPPADVKIS